MELAGLVDLAHPLVRLGEKINWVVFEDQLGSTFDRKTGAPGISTRLMVALHYLKYQYNLSDEAVVARWVENPYWQHFSGRQFFEHELPIDPSSMTRWRKRLGEAGAETMLKATIETGMAMKAITPAQMCHVNVDTTVQSKAIRFSTDARLYDRARECLVVHARKHNGRLQDRLVTFRQIGAHCSRVLHTEFFRDWLPNVPGEGFGRSRLSSALFFP